MKQYLISSSILSADFARLGEEVTEVLSAGADIIHLDIMDNHYVPNLSMGSMVLKSLRDYGISSQIDVHLMIKPVDRIIPDFARAGANVIIFHPETSNHIDYTLNLIKKEGCKAGLALNPATPLTCLDYIMDKLDVILLMSVNPGCGNQLFITSILGKIFELRRRINESKYRIILEVDGGIKISNISKIAEAGANVFVVGSAIFDQLNYRKVIDEMHKELEKIHD